MEESPGIRQDLISLEDEAFGWQIKIYDLHLDIFREEEKLAKTQKEAITRTIEGTEIPNIQKSVFHFKLGA